MKDRLVVDRDLRHVGDPRHDEIVEITRLDDSILERDVGACEIGKAGFCRTTAVPQVLERTRQFTVVEVLQHGGSLRPATGRRPPPRCGCVRRCRSGNVPSHGGIDLGCGGLAAFGQRLHERRRAHDLAALAVAALGDAWQECHRRLDTLQDPRRASRLSD